MAKNVAQFMVDVKSELLKKTAVRLRDNGDVTLFVSARALSP